MEQYYKYSFEVTHDNGSFFTSVISYNLDRAKEAICKMENCPLSAIEYIRKEKITI